MDKIWQQFAVNNIESTVSVTTLVYVVNNVFTWIYDRTPITVFSFVYDCKLSHSQPIFDLGICLSYVWVNKYLSSC